jgi:hypothetical protein
MEQQHRYDIISLHQLAENLPAGQQEGADGQLVHDGLTEAQLLVLAEMEAEEEEKHAVAEFKRRLDFNMRSVRTPAAHFREWGSTAWFHLWPSGACGRQGWLCSF